MKKSGNPFMIAFGVILFICAGYWIYKGGEILEIVLPVIFGIAFIGMAFYRFEDNITKPK